MSDFMMGAVIATVINSMLWMLWILLGIVEVMI